jgi:Holliday junction resolvase RusA-like endonuclease
MTCDAYLHAQRLAAPEGPLLACTWTGDLTGVTENHRLINGRIKNRAYRDFQASLIPVMWASRREMDYPGAVSVKIDLYVNKRRDIDNLIKPILDCLQKAQVIQNDSQVVRLEVTKHEKVNQDLINISLLKQEGNNS